MQQPPREGWIDNDGLRLRYVAWGDAAAPALVALHGLRSFARTWEPVAQPLSHRFQLIALDQRGRGQSDWDPQRRYYAEAYVRDLSVLVDHLALPRFVLLGHSMGGANAFVYAAAQPQRVAGLVIEDMGPGASAGSAGADRIKRELLATPDRFDSAAAAAAFWRGQRPHIAEEAVLARVRHSMRVQDDGSVVWRHDAPGIAQARLNATPAQLVDLWPHVAAVQAPTLVLRGAQSDFLSAATAREMAERNPRIRCVDIPAASHYVHDDNFQDFMAALTGFLDSPALQSWAQGAAS
jgi:pimeloyl-ACP methyl ester carboxylesterase